MSLKRIINFSVNRENKILVASWLVAKLPGGEMTGNQYHMGIKLALYITI